MAELGVAASVAGLVSLVIQLGTGINKLVEIQRSVEKAPEKLSLLIVDLNLSHMLLQIAKDNEHRLDPYILHHCRHKIEPIARGIGELVDQFESVKRRKRYDPIYVFKGRGWITSIQMLHGKIGELKTDLLLLNAYTKRSYPGPQGLGNPHERSTVSVKVEDTLQIIDLQDNKGEAVVQNASQKDQQADSLEQSVHEFLTKSRASAIYARRRNQDCISRTCPCACHITTSFTSRFWAIEYFLPRPCSVSSCDSASYGWKVRLSLSQLGIWRSVEFGLSWQITPGKLSLGPCLQVDQIVPFTSPGFEAIWKARTGQIDLREARDELIKLERSDPTFKRHTDPRGTTYIESLLAWPWSPGYEHCQFALLKLLICDFGISIDTMHSKFLSTCASWIGEGPHLYLLQTLVDLGFQASDLDSQTWPMPCDPNWISESHTPDPFFIEYTRICSKDNQGFAGMTPLHEAVIQGPSASVDRWIAVCAKDERDCLGRSPMHLAVCTPSHLRTLIAAGHNLDAQDQCGITPLMYAAAMDQKESVVILIENGSYLTLQDERLGRTALDYACVRKNWALLLIFLNTVERVHGQEVCGACAEIAIVYYMQPQVARNDSGSLFKEIISKILSVNFLHSSINADSNSLMHLVSRDSEGLILLGNGFSIVNHINAAGESPLSVAARNGNASLIRVLIRAGASVFLNDDPRSHALVSALAALRFNFGGSCMKYVEAVRECLVSCRDLLIPVECKCPCSSPAYLATFSLPWTTRPRAWRCTSIPILSLELLSMLTDTDRLHERREILLALIRKAEFDKLGMTHVCAGVPFDLSFDTMNSFNSPSIATDDADDILDEESEFISHLDDISNKRHLLSFDALLLEWFQLFKLSLKEQQMRFEGVKRAPSGKPHKSFYVDRKRDMFVGPCISMIRVRNSSSDVVEDIRNYIRWLEYDYHCGSSSQLPPNAKDAWYHTRHRWLRQLLHELQIPRAQIVEALREDRRRALSNGYGDDFAEMDIEDAIAHFESGWRCGQASG